MSEALAIPTATTVERCVIAAGGGHAEAAPYSLDGTVGQAVVGSASQTAYGLCSGFWCGEWRWGQGSAGGIGWCQEPRTECIPD